MRVMPMESIEIISATRQSKEEFWQQTALGQSLIRLSPDSRLSYHICCSNKLGLPEVYNSRLQYHEGADIKVFIHDDVWLDDYFFIDRIIAGLQQYDVIGVAGNRRLVAGQPGWACTSKDGPRFIYDEPANLSGAVAHGQQPFGKVARFGAMPAECELLDGVMLAARKSVLLQRGVLFDQRFDFHFYDLDFCRTARAQGLRLATWPVAMTHQSLGHIGSAYWMQRYQTYLDKWQE